MTAPEQPPVPVTALADPNTLTHAQTGGWGCVLCGRRLIDAPGQPLSTVTVKGGSARVVREVWVCASACGAKPVAPEPEPTAWSQFLDHAAGCADCRSSHRCAAGDELHDAVRREARAATP